MQDLSEATTRPASPLVSLEEAGRPLSVLHISSIANAAKFNNLFQSAMSCSLADGGLEASNTDQGQDQQPSIDL